MCSIPSIKAERNRNEVALSSTSHAGTKSCGTVAKDLLIKAVDPRGAAKLVTALATPAAPTGAAAARPVRAGCVEGFSLSGPCSPVAAPMISNFAQMGSKGVDYASAVSALDSKMCYALGAVASVALMSILASWISSARNERRCKLEYALENAKIKQKIDRDIAVIIARCELRARKKAIPPSAQAYL